MTTATVSSLGELLKRLYASWEIEQLVNLTYPLLAQCFATGSADLGGVGFYFPVRTKSAEGHAYISETQALPTGQISTVNQAVITPTVHAGVVQVSGLSMALSSGNAMAFAKAFDENVQQTIESMSAYKEGVAFRDGSGLLASFDGAVATSAGPHTVDDVGHLRPGMFVDIIDVAGVTRHNTDLEIASVDWVNKTVTFESAVAAAVDDTDEIFIAGSQGASGDPDSNFLEPIGLEGSLLASGTYLGIDRSAVGTWQANVMAANNFLDEDVLLRARTRLTQVSGIRLSGISRRMKLVTHPMQADNLFRLAIPRIQFAAGGSFDLGNADEASFGRIPVLTSYAAPTDKAYLGDWSYSQSLYAPGGELHIDTEYNNSALKWVNGYDQGLAFMKEYCAFINRRPNAFVRITGLTEATR